MLTTLARTAALLAVGVGLASILLAAPAPPQPAKDIIKDRKNFIPQRKHQPLPGSVVGVLVSDVRAMMGQEGRSGPPDAMGFSSNGNSYRWMYVPVQENVLITNLSVQVGEKGDQRKMYPQLSMASPTTVKQWGIEAPYALVEVEVNDTQGTPAIEGFVATKMKRLDGTKEYPLEVGKVVDDVRKRYQRHLRDEKKAIDDALAEQQKKAIKDRKPTGPRQTEELFYLTWLPESKHLRVHFRTRISDGAFQMGGGGANPGPRPVPLPLPPARGKGAALQAAPPAAIARKVPPPRPMQFRFGTKFGIEFGMAYEVDKTGRLVKVLTLPFEGFQQEIPPPPGVGGGPVPLPPRPLPKQD